jgi:hypothetical protein
MVLAPTESHRCCQAARGQVRLSQADLVPQRRDASMITAPAAETDPRLRHGAIAEPELTRWRSMTVLFCLWQPRRAIVFPQGSYLGAQSV